ncbi:MAG: winged helix-turn-helix domain-containing protein, partial [Clostridia bacterium]
SHTALKGGHMVSLKPMEYELLRTFIKHPGMMLTREALLHQVWGDEYIGETRTVDVHVAALRKKLCWNERITTVYKLGYRLEVDA